MYVTADMCILVLQNNIMFNVNKCSDKEQNNKLGIINFHECNCGCFA